MTAHWTTPIGKDVVSLNATLADWLGTRLVFLATHTHSCPVTYIEAQASDAEGYAVWREDLLSNGRALMAFAAARKNGDDDHIEEAQDAMRWVADNLTSLWD